jgi:hypothetical protein
MWLPTQLQYRLAASPCSGCLVQTNKYEALTAVVPKAAAVILTRVIIVWVRSCKCGCSGATQMPTKTLPGAIPFLRRAHVLATFSMDLMVLCNAWTAVRPPQILCPESSHLTIPTQAYFVTATAQRSDSLFDWASACWGEMDLHLFERPSDCSRTCSHHLFARIVSFTK